MIDSNEHREAARSMARRQEAAEDSALSFGREFIKANQWLNGGALAALPVIAGALGLSGERALQAFLWPGLFFIAGLVAVALSIGAAYFALTVRSFSHGSMADALQVEAAVLENKRPIKAGLAEGRDGRATSDLQHWRSNAWAAVACSFAALSLAAFIMGAVCGGRYALNLLATPAAAAAPPAAVETGLPVR